ncbi:SDR family NAD(P)-dependent oxidoreductase [Pseudooceanicola atlanticus]|jgi:NAD(P)-dependent dehydrogenase (short-subunit alcohol dehydrogenase family)|uniref:Oxidoreductase n=1 Tax=Pseudooceanicola atlanticus TaxID=1461694 RepID=A0A0A0EH25_9RHOB|nr:SDR family oxidoreductase [Pseudooceanicola atlanticus]KGM48497.1 oxidoreductase [Pseudooceanicola atlanticus]
MTDKIALITGASRGLGASLAKALAPTHHIVAVARTVGALEELDDTIRTAGGAVTLAPMDITKPDAMAQLCRSIHDRWGGAALWAHTAIHAAPLSPAAHIDAKDWAKSVEINVTAMGHLVPYIAALLGSEGTALFFDDAAVGTKFHGAYGATKAAQIALVRSWAAESAASGPNVQVLTPSPMPTATRARFHPGEDRTNLIHPDQEAKRLLAGIV